MKIQHRDRCIIVFIKPPESGNVKQRLAHSIGNDHATHLYQAFIQDTLHILATASYPVFLFVSPSEKNNTFLNQLQKKYVAYTQQGTSLGERMDQALHQMIQEGYHQLLLIGSDSPDLPVDFFHHAFSSLSHVDVVLGPSSDGGYYLIGCTPSGFCHEIFSNIPWSTSQVLSQTLQRCRKTNKSVELLPVWYDIDTLVDLHGFIQRTQAIPSSSSVTRSYVLAHPEIFITPCTKPSVRKD